MTSSPEQGRSVQPTARLRADGSERRALTDGWHLATAAPGLRIGAADLNDLDWQPARVPGTAAAALREAGKWQQGEPYDFDAEDWWFRTSFLAEPPAASEEVTLHLDGIATVSEIYLNGELLLESDSMFTAHTLNVGRLLGPHNELTICCRALKGLLAPRRRPRARWRTRLVEEGNLRFFRTMLLGRAPGFAPGPAAVGPWRGVFLERRRHHVVEELDLRPHLSGTEGQLDVLTRLRTLEHSPLDSVEIELSGPLGTRRAQLTLSTVDELVEARGELRLPEVACWWPHTHGEPVLYEARLLVSSSGETHVVDAGRVGFRSLASGPRGDGDIETEGLQLHVNGVPIFARGAVWTPVDAIGLKPSPRALRTALEQARDAGMNLLRIPGTSAYEEQAFYDLCDELGILVWQDFMFANLDYPISEEGFRATVVGEATQLLGGLAGRPSLAVLCGNSEVEQQAAMFGLDPALGRGELFGELLPRIVRESGADAIYVPSAPCGGDLPFRPNRGIANYYGVGGYRLPLDDARRAGVRFAAECLAFANVPDEAILEELMPDTPGGVVVHHPRWKAGVPRDVGSGWDFDDVRDHYLGLLFGVDPGELRRSDHGRYLALSRALSGEVMSEVFGEWRRAGSPCGGALVLWLRDLAPGAGWGVIDHRGGPKVAYHYLRRALAPVAVWTSDERLGGVLAHVANDRPTPLKARLRVALYRGLEQLVEQARVTIELPPHSTCERGIEALVGHFTDISWTYRFGPPAQDLIVVSLEREEAEGSKPISQSMRFPVGYPTVIEPTERLGLRALALPLEDGGVRLTVSTRRLAWCVRLHVPGFTAEDDAFSVEPNGERVIHLRPSQAETSFSGGSLTALNMDGRLRIETPEEQA